MLRLSTTDDVIASLEAARNVAVEAYTIHGPVLKALEGAARRGATVCVELEKAPFDDAKGSLARENARVAAELRAAGAQATLADPIHAKRMSIDGAIYLDEKNWHLGDIVLRGDAVDAASIAMTKDEALAQEARLLSQGRAGDGIIVESESFGAGNAAYRVLRALGRDGAAPRLLVSERDLRGNGRERAILSDLTRCGVHVRLCKDSSKLAVCGDRAWLGSANATYADGKYSMPDWGVRTDDAAIVGTVRAHLEGEWATAKELKPELEV
jgi:hypothetical protein